MGSSSSSRFCVAGSALDQASSAAGVGIAEDGRQVFSRQPPLYDDRATIGIYGREHAQRRPGVRVSAPIEDETLDRRGRGSTRLTHPNVLRQRLPLPATRQGPVPILLALAHPARIERKFLSSHLCVLFKVRQFDSLSIRQIRVSSVCWPLGTSHGRAGPGSLTPARESDCRRGR